MKKILLVVLLIIIAIAVTPYYFGMKAEKQYHEIVSKIKQSPNVTVKKKSYERGFFNSNAKTILEIKSKSKSIILNSEDNITHGPFDIMGFTKGKINLTPFVATVDSDATIKIPVTTDSGETKTIAMNSEGNTDISFDGTAESRYIIPKYKIIKQSENLVFNWSGVEMNFIYDYKSNNLNSSFLSKSLDITDPDTTFKISNITAKSTTSDIKQNLQSLTGDFEMKIKSIKFASADEKIDMSNLSFSGFSKTSSGKLNMGMKVIGDKLITSEYEFGPLTYDIAIKNIDAAAWEKIQDSANKMKVADSPMEQGMQVMGVLPELVKHSPVIEIKQISLKSSLGDLNADARIKVKGDNPEMLQNILLIGNTLEAEASIVASKSLVDFYIEKTSTNQDIEIETDNNNVSEGADKLSEGQVFLEGEMKDSIESSDNSSGIKSFIDNGYLIPDGKNYSFKASLKQGQVTINGKPVPLAQMMLQ